MPFLDRFRGSKEQQPVVEQQSQQQPRNEVSRDVSTTRSQEQFAAKPAEYVRPDQQSRLAEAQALYNKGTQEVQQTTPAPTSAPDDGTTNPQPMRQAMSGQDKAAPDLSPTSAQRGVRGVEVERPSAPAQTPAQSQRQTIARPAPSWER